MADAISNLSRPASIASVLSDSSKMEALPTTQGALTGLQRNFSLQNPSNQNGSLISMFVKGMKIIQDQAVIIEMQAKQLQQQEVEIETLRAELKNAQKNQEQNSKKEEKPSTTINTATTSYNPYRESFMRKDPFMHIKG